MLMMLAIFLLGADAFVFAITADAHDAELVVLGAAGHCFGLRLMPMMLAMLC